MIPWLWIRTGDPAIIIYAIAMNILYWTAMIPEIKQYLAIEKAGDIKRVPGCHPVQCRWG